MAIETADTSRITRGTRRMRFQASGVVGPGGLVVGPPGEVVVHRGRQALAGAVFQVLEIEHVTPVRGNARPSARRRDRPVSRRPPPGPPAPGRAPGRWTPAPPGWPPGGSPEREVQRPAVEVGHPAPGRLDHRRPGGVVPDAVAVVGPGPGPQVDLGHPRGHRPVLDLAVEAHPASAQAGPVDDRLQHCRVAVRRLHAAQDAHPGGVAHLAHRRSARALRRPAAPGRPPGPLPPQKSSPRGDAGSAATGGDSPAPRPPAPPRGAGRPPRRTGRGAGSPWCRRWGRSPR